MFNKCRSFKMINKLNIFYVTDMSYIFISYLCDISKWDTNNVKNMNGIFYGSSSLSSLPDISKWNTNMLMI